MLKELGKLLRNFGEGGLIFTQARVGGTNQGVATVYKNTGLCEAARRRIGSDACPVPGRLKGGVQALN
jgi:hypothetical protein